MSIEIISEKKTQIGQVTVTFTVGRIVSRAKATEGKAGMAGDDVSVRRSTAGTGLRVGEASADLPATSEFMDVTAGETALNSPAVADTRRAGSAGLSPPDGFSDPAPSSVEER
jgi:hypothetical protein